MERPDPEDREGMPAMKRLRKSVSFDETKRQHDTLADALVDASRPASADSEPQPPYPVEAQVESSAEGIEGTGAASESASGPSAMDLDGASTAGTAPHSTADATYVAGAAAPSEAPLGSAGETSEIPAANTGVAVQTNTWAAVGAPNGGAADGTYRSEGGRMSSMSSSSLTPEGGWRAEEAEAMDRSTSRSISGTSSFDMEEGDEPAPLVSPMATAISTPKPDPSDPRWGFYPPEDSQHTQATQDAEQAQDAQQTQQSGAAAGEVGDDRRAAGPALRRSRGAERAGAADGSGGGGGWRGAAEESEGQETATAGSTRKRDAPGGVGAGSQTVRSKVLSTWAVGSRYELKRVLGSGSYGDVAEGYDRVKERKVAIKRVLNIFDEETEAKRIYREMYILRRLQRCPEIITLLDVILPHGHESTELYLVFEYVDTDLYKLILSPQYLTVRHIQTFLYQLLTGLKYIHSALVIHRDLKPANILLNEDCTLKICDFGLSRVVTGDKMMKQSQKEPASVGSSSSNTSSGSGSASRGKGTRGRGNTSASSSSSSDAGRDISPPNSHVEASSSSSSSASASSSSSSGSTGSTETVGSKSRKKETAHRNGSGAEAAAGTGAGGGGFNDIGRPRPLKRQLTKHVVTRWYRGPELILLQDYTSAVDMWSVGCIFAELLSMQKESVDQYEKRMPLFPGKSCFPLSHGNQSYEDRRDQLNVIFSVIGTPTSTDIHALDEQSAQMYLNELPNREAKPLAEYFPGAGATALSLLSSMLQFDPRRRLTVEEALAHDFLFDFRQGHQGREKEANEPLTMDIDNIPEPSEGNQSDTKDRLRHRICEEVMYYRNRDAREGIAPSFAQSQPQSQQQTSELPEPLRS